MPRPSVHALTIRAVADGWDIATAIGTIVGAGATAVAAIAAWKAASASERTSARASEALANTIIPRVRYAGVQRVRDDGTVIEDTVGADGNYVFPTDAGELVVIVGQDPPFAARDVDVVVTRDGTEYHEKADWMRDGERIQVRAGAAPTDRDSTRVGLVLDSVRTRFSDERGLATYECFEDFTGLTDAPVAPKRTETRIWPTRGPVVRPAVHHGSW